MVHRLGGLSAIRGEMIDLRQIESSVAGTLIPPRYSRGLSTEADCSDHSTACLNRLKEGIIYRPLGRSIYLGRNVVARKKAKTSEANGQPKRRKLSAEESLQRMMEFDKRKESFIAALRKSKNRSLSS
jgi:hypothetical protein